MHITRIAHNYAKIVTKTAAYGEDESRPIGTDRSTKETVYAAFAIHDAADFPRSTRSARMVRPEALHAKFASRDGGPWVPCDGVYVQAAFVGKDGTPGEAVDVDRYDFPHRIDQLAAKDAMDWVRAAYPRRSVLARALWRAVLGAIPLQERNPRS